MHYKLSSEWIKSSINEIVTDSLTTSFVKQKLPIPSLKLIDYLTWDISPIAINSKKYFVTNLYFYLFHSPDIYSTIFRRIVVFESLILAPGAPGVRNLRY